MLFPTLQATSVRLRASRQVSCVDGVGTDVYVDINGWHLYLKDISVTPDLKLHELLADQLAPDLLSKGFDERRIEAFLKQVSICVLSWDWL